MTIKKLVAALTCSLLASAALAAGKPGFYVGGDVGYNWTPDTDYQFTTGTHKTQFDRGDAWSLHAGYSYGNGFRVEGEYAERESDVTSFNSYPGAGQLKTEAFAVNGFYDFATNSGFTPFVGLGVGMARVKAKGIHHTANPDCCTGYVTGDDEVGFAQAMLGVSYAFTQNFSLVADYRFIWGFSTPTLNYLTACNTDGSGCSSGGDTNQALRQQVLSIGLRYTF